MSFRFVKSSLPSHQHSSAGFTLAEVMVALGLIAFSLASLFAVFSQGLQMVRAQQETMSAALCLQDRSERVRSLKWGALTDATQLAAGVYSKGAVNANGLPAAEEEATVSVFPAPAAAPTPLSIHRSASGTVKTVSAPTDGSLTASPTVRVDLRVTWTSSRGRVRVRESSAVMAAGGIRP